MKLLMILYLSGYLVRRSQVVRESLRGFINAMAVLIFISSLILLERIMSTLLCYLHSFWACCSWLEYRLNNSSYG
ncbi:MAG: hypothetical protein R3E08_06965 [Thiotrichaceae bacterium]